MKTILMIFLTIFATNNLVFSDINKKINNKEIKKYLNEWGKQYSNYDENTYSLVIGNSVLNCLTCIRRPINEIIDFIHKEEFHINVFNIFEVDLKNESVGYRKYYKQCMFAEDMDNILINKFGLKQFPTIFLIDKYGKIVKSYDTLSLYKNEIKEIVRKTTKPIFTTKNIQIRNISYLMEKKDNLISDASNIIYMPISNSIFIFQKNLSSLSQFEINSGKLINFTFLNDSLYKYFIKLSDNSKIWEIIAKNSIMTNYMTMSENIYNDRLYFLTKIHCGYSVKKINNKVNVIESIGYFLVSLNYKNMKYDIIKKIDIGGNGYELTNFLQLVNNNIYFPQIYTKYLKNDFIEKNTADSLYLLCKYNLSDKHLSHIINLKQIMFRNRIPSLSKIFLKSYKNELLYIDRMKNLFLIIENDSIKLQTSNILSKYASYHISDVLLNDKNIIILLQSDTKSKIILLIYNKQFNLSSIINPKNLPEDLLKSKLINLIDNRILLLLKSKAHRWGVYEIFTN